MDEYVNNRNSKYGLKCETYIVPVRLLLAGGAAALERAGEL